MSFTSARAWTDDELLALAERLDNAGRWGADDELGTLNYITPEKRVQAASLVGDGITVSLARPLAAEPSPPARVDLQHRVMFLATPDERIGTPPFAGDYIGLESHQPGVTHLDAVGHIGGSDGRIYGGRRFAAEVGEDGLRFGSVFAQRHGIVSRGVFLDIPAAHGAEWLEPEHEVSAADLEAAERLARVEVTAGDVAVVRTGIEARAAVHGHSALSPGPGPEAALWFHERQVAAFAGDSPERIGPSAARILGRAPRDGPPDDGVSTRFPLPFHQLALPMMGLVLLDHAAVEELAGVCRGLDRYEFLFVAAPLALPSATGSAVNPLAIF